MQNTLLLVLLSFLTACGGGTARTPVESPDPELVTEGADASDDASAVEPTLSVVEREMFESMVRSRIGELLYAEAPENHIGILGALEVNGGHVAAFLVRSESRSIVDEERFLLVVFTPDDGDYLGHVIDLGAAQREPGAESILRVEGLEGLRLDNGVIRAELTIVRGYAEFDTCSDCQGRRVSPTIRHEMSVLCFGSDPPWSEGCSLAETALEIVSPGVEIDGTGERHPPLEPDPPEYELRLEVLNADTIRLNLVSGSLPEDMEDVLGEETLNDASMSQML